MTSDSTILIAAHAWYGDLIGGSFRLATEFARYLASQGRRVAYVCSDVTKAEGGARGAECEVCEGVELYRYPPRAAGSLVPALWYHVAATRRIVRRLARERSLIAISGHSPLQFLGACLAVPGRQAFRNYTVHSPFDDELLADSVRRTGLRHKTAARVARWIDRQNIRLAHRVQADSQYTLDALAHKHGRHVVTKGVVSPGWVDAESFRPAPDRAAERARLGGPWRTDLPIFFTLRRLESRMGLDTLIDAADRLKQRGATFRVLIGGGGSLTATLDATIRERRLEDCVVLLGRIEQEDVPACYAAADCFVLPTRALECFGLIVLEAYATDTPVIASDVAAIPELVSQAGDPWLFAPGNDEQLANRMHEFLDGRLQPQRDLREIAMAYDQRLLLPQWAKLVGR